MMLHTLLFLWAAAGGDDPANVTELRVVPASAGYTEVVVRMSGEVAYSDFLLTNPPRLIVDLKGARHALPRDNFENINRGGVVRVRTSQFRDDVVRIVVELSEPTSYTLVGSESSESPSRGAASRARRPPRCPNPLSQMRLSSPSRSSRLRLSSKSRHSRRGRAR